MANVFACKIFDTHIIVINGNNILASIKSHVIKGQIVGVKNFDMHTIVNIQENA